MPAVDRGLARLKTAPTGSEAHPTSYSMVTAVPSGGVGGGRKVDHSPAFRAEVKNEWTYTTAPNILNTFRKRVKNVVTSMGLFQVRLECK